MSGNFGFAPTREAIEALADIAAINERLDEAEEIEISITAYLKHDVMDDEMRRRRIAALVHWQKAIRNIKLRARVILRESREAKDV